MRTFLVNDTSTSANWGCRATSRSLRYMLGEVGAHVTSTMYLSEMVSNEQVVLASGERLPRPVPLSATNLDRYASYIESADLLPDVRSGIVNADLVYINGEGSIYDLQPKGLMQLLIAYTAKVKFGRPVVLANLTAEFHDSRMADIACEVLPLCDDIVFREAMSHRHCLEMVSGIEASVAADAAYTLEPLASDTWDEVAGRDTYLFDALRRPFRLDVSRPVACLAGSSIYFRADRPSYEPLPAFAEIARRLTALGFQVICCVPCEKDARIFEPLAERLSLPLVPVDTPTQQAVDLLGNASVFISGRWHPSIFAATGGTPPVLLTANTHKTDALVEQLGLEGQAYNALELRECADEIILRATQLVEQGDEMRRAVRARAEELRRLAWRNVEFIGQPREPGLPAQGSVDRQRVDAAPLRAPHPPTEAASARWSWWLELRLLSLEQLAAARNLSPRSVRRLEVLDPQLAVAAASLVESEILRERERVLELIGEIEDSDGHALEVYLLVGDMLFDLGRYANAESFFSRARALKPKSRGALRGLAKCAIVVGDETTALGYLDQYARLVEGNDRYVELLALHLLRHDMADRALEVLAQILSGDIVSEQNLVPFVDWFSTIDMDSRQRRLLEQIAAKCSSTSIVSERAREVLQRNPVAPGRRKRRWLDGTGAARTSAVASRSGSESRSILFVCEHDSSLKVAECLVEEFVAHAWRTRKFVCLSDDDFLRASVRSRARDGAWEHGDLDLLFLRLRPELFDVIHVGIAGPRIKEFVDRLDRVCAQSGTSRPLLVGGYLGIACMGLESGYLFREPLDIVFLNSARDQQDIFSLRERMGVAPFDPPGVPVTGLPILDDVVRARETRDPVSGRVIFAAQPTLPGSREEREWLASEFVRWGRTVPDCDIVIKPRARPEQRSLLNEENHIAEVFDDLSYRGVSAPNVRIVYDDMRTLLRSADLLVTISSTAAFEALAIGVRAAILSDFGLRESHGTVYFAGSGLTTSIRNLVDGCWPPGDPVWLDQNLVADARSCERVRSEVERALANREAAR